MISAKSFIEYLQAQGICFFSGVPDSLLKSVCACIEQTVDKKNHVIAANEGNAVGLAMGHYMATQQVPLVYLQNSGLGNMINPLLSLADQAIYGIPMMILMGWRGEPGIKDEPQHLKQGKVMCHMLEAMEIPYFLLDKDFNVAKMQVDKALKQAKENLCPVVMNVSKNTFEAVASGQDHSAVHALKREQAIQILVEELHDPNRLFVATTGMISRELYEVRENVKQSHSQDFLTVGGMGHASSIALGLAMAQPNRPIVCLDGDGAAIMHLGGLAIAGAQNCENLLHILINNGAHDSVGGQPTVALEMDWVGITRSMGYRQSYSISDEQSLRQTVRQAMEVAGPTFIEVKVNKGNRKDLGRPKISPEDAKKMFMAYAESQQ